MPPSAPRHARSRVPHPLRALRHRNYRLFFFGQGISLVGTWLQQTALPYLSYKTNESALELTTVMFLTQIPQLALGPAAGVLGDRFDRKSLVIVTQTLAMVQAFVLAWLTLADAVQMWHIYSLSLMLGCVAAFDLPVRQAMMFDLIDSKQDIGNAVALNSTLVNLARVIGPSIAGVLIGLSRGHTATCFLLNGVSFVAVLISLAMIRIPPAAHPPHHEPALHALREGFGHTFSFPPNRLVLALVAVSSITAMSFTVLMPVYADHIRHDDPHAYGLLMAAGGLGALMGSIHLAAQPSPLGLIRLIPVGAAMSAVGMLAFALTTELWACAVLRVVASAGVLIQMAASNTILHALAGNRHRARVMAIYSMAFVGMAPVGSILGGQVAHHASPQTAAALAGIATALAAVYFLLRLPTIQRQIAGRTAE
jgi:MFS family permease